MSLSTILVLWMVSNRCRMQRSWVSCIRKFFRLSRRMCRHCSYYCYNNNIFSRSLEYKILCWWRKYPSGRFQILFHIFLPKLFLGRENPWNLDFCKSSNTYDLKPFLACDEKGAALFHTKRRKCCRHASKSSKGIRMGFIEVKSGSRLTVGQENCHYHFKNHFKRIKLIRCLSGGIRSNVEKSLCLL